MPQRLSQLQVIGRLQIAITLITLSRIMEPIHGTRKQSKSAQEEDDNDVISNMPDNVITNILDCLPIKDAVSTGILSRNWRFKWTMLSQLVFDIYLCEYLHEIKKYERFINWLLLHLKGAITKFCLYIHEECYFEDINNWIRSLSTKGIQELTLINISETPLKLPSHLFSCLQLKYLKLSKCDFPPMPSFRDFPNLLNVDFYRVRFESYECGQFIARCPSLEILKIIDFKLTSNVISKLVNLKFLSLSYGVFDDTKMLTRSGIIQFIGCLPKLQKLSLDLWMCQLLAEAGAEKKVPTTFPCLRNLSLNVVDFSSDIMVSLVFEMISCSPNLQTLHITEKYTDDIHVRPPAICFSDFDCNKMEPLKLLKSVVFELFRGLENELCLIKYILASSPFLKKIVIKPVPSSFVGGDLGKFNFAQKLLKLHRASPTAEIELYQL